MATQTYVYNRTLQILKQSRLSSVSEDVPARHELDVIYDRLKYDFLEEAFWKFAMKTAKIDADAAITPNFGQAYAFGIPVDWVRTYALSSSEFADSPLSQSESWQEEGGYWWSNTDPIYVRYVSKSVDYGLDLDKWTGKYTEAFCYEMAKRAVGVVSGDDFKAFLEAAEMALSKAKNFEALREPMKYQHQGRWNTARFWGSRSRGSGRIVP